MYQIVILRCIVKRQYKILRDTSKYLKSNLENEKLFAKNIYIFFKLPCHCIHEERISSLQVIIVKNNASK